MSHGFGVVGKEKSKRNETAIEAIFYVNGVA